MAKPQQPEIARSGRGATDPAAVKSEHTAPSTARVAGGDGAPIPEDNLPGHHPEHEQDKPSGDAFVAKLREHAAEAEAEPEPVPVSGEDGDRSLEDTAGTIAGEALRAAAGLVRKVRERLPGD